MAFFLLDPCRAQWDDGSGIAYRHVPLRTPFADVVSRIIFDTTL